MSQTVRDRVCLVTGGGRGIGAAIAGAAGAGGASVVVNFRSDEGSAARVVESIRSGGGVARAIRADVSDSEQVKRMFREIKDDLGGVEILVNNAGVLSSALLGMTREADFDSQMAVNAKGTFLCMQQAAKQMARRERGRIVNVSSIVGRVGTRGHVAYAASKAAVIGMSLAAAKELGPLGITVNAVAPGFIRTEMTATFADEVRDEIVAAIPLGRAGTAHEVARLVLFLAADESDYLNGQVLGVDGGQVM